jgi:CHAP domain
MSVESVLQRVAVLEQALANPAALLAASARTGGTAAPAALSGTAPAASTANGTSFAEALQSASAGTSTAATGLASATDPTAASAMSSALQLPGDPSVASPTPPTAYGSPTVAASTIPTSYTGLAGVSGLGTLAPASTGLASGTSTGARIVAIAESQLGQAEQPPGSNESPAIEQYRTATAGAMPGAPWCAYFASWAARQAGAPLGAQGEGLGSVSEIWSWAQSTGRAIANGPGVVPQPGDLIVFGGEHVGIVKDVLPNGDIQTVEGNYENKVAQNVRTPSEATGYVNMN